MWLHQTQWLGMDENRSNDKEICELIPSDIYFPICMTFTNNEIRTPIIFLWRLFFITVLAKTDWVCHHQAQKQPPHPTPLNQNLRLSYKQQKQTKNNERDEYVRVLSALLYSTALRTTSLSPLKLLTFSCMDPSVHCITKVRVHIIDFCSFSISNVSLSLNFVISIHFTYATALSIEKTNEFDIFWNFYS